MRVEWIMSWLVTVSFGLMGCGSSNGDRVASLDAPPAAVAPTPAPAKTQEQQPVQIHRDGRFLVSGQPDEAALRTAQSEGVTTVISCRSDEEMAGLGFDEAALVQSLGMRYVHVAMGRDHGYSPEQLAQFTSSLRQAQGPVYVHCASGARARNAIMGYLIREQGYSVDEAMKTALRLGQEEPILDQLLGQRVNYGLDQSR
jgi:uncharacterized protein (TIGR01244 family)